MREKHGKQRRGRLKVHVAVDVDSKKLLSLEVAKEEPARSTSVLEYKNWATKAESKCTSAGDGGRLKDSSHRSISSIKRIFGDTIRAFSPNGMISEVKRTFILCNILIGI
jgi:hypothetical protein